MEQELDVNKITAEVFVKISTSMAEKSWKVLCQYCKDLKNKTQVDIGTAYLEYLDFSYENINKVKTLLYKENGRPLYAFYECIGVKYESQIIAANNVKNIYEIGNFIIITGTGGIGKTIMLKHFFLNCIESTTFVPVLINVRCVNEIDVLGKSLVDIIQEEMKNYHFNLEREYLEYSLESGNYLFLFDGFDEINESQGKWMEKEILKFCRRYPDNHYIMTSRPSERFVGWNDFIELKALPLTKKQALSMIDKLDYDKIVKINFHKALDNGLFETYSSFASNPLLLTIMLITFENNASIPDKLIDFYEQAFLTLFSKHDARKEMYRREIKSKLSYADFKKVFSCFCFLTYLKRHFVLKEYEVLEFIEKAKKLANLQNDFDASIYLDDVINVVCMLIQDGCDLSFSHRSFQEYFTTVYISTLSDEDQVQLVNRMVLNSRSMEVDNVFNLLYDLQPERSVKNIVYPALLSWKKEIDEAGSYEEFLLTKYDRLSFRKYDKGSSFGVGIKDYAYSSLQHFIRRVIYKPRKKREKDDIKENVKIMEAYFVQHNIRYLDFESLRKTEIWDNFCVYLNIWVDDITNAMEFLTEYEKTKSNPKEKFDDFFDF